MSYILFKKKRKRRKIDLEKKREREKVGRKVSKFSAGLD